MWDEDELPEGDLESVYGRAAVFARITALTERLFKKHDETIGWDNVGVLCPSCQRLKWQHWPWLDYRPTLYKRKIEAYLQEKYGRQLWLGEEPK